MSRLISVELRGSFINNNTLDEFINFFKQEQIQYLYDNELNVAYFLDDDIEFGYLSEGDILNYTISAISVTYLIDGERYSLLFSLNHDDKLEISFGGIKKIDNCYADFSWVYKHILKSIREKLFLFRDIIYYDMA